VLRERALGIGILIPLSVYFLVGFAEGNLKASFLSFTWNKNSKKMGTRGRFYKLDVLLAKKLNKIDSN